MGSPIQTAFRLLRWSKVIALDIETTGLDARTDRMRLLTLSDGNDTVSVDCFEEDPRPLFPLLQTKQLIAHNAAFDLGFLYQMGLKDIPETVCTWLIEEVLQAGAKQRCSLGAAVQRHLGRQMDKELQGSNWSGSLSEAQLRYARLDAEMLVPLYQAQYRTLQKQGLEKVAEIECRALPGWVWLCQSGVPFDRDEWLRLEAKASQRAAELESQLDTLAPTKGDEGLFGAIERWNWNSPQQVKDVMSSLGCEVDTTCDAQLALIDKPPKAAEAAKLLRDQREHSQLVKMYGANWLAAATIHEGRVYPNWRQIGTETGRTTCKGPNFQQIPRNKAYRACVRATVGKVIVKADYSTLQMRIAARLAEDKELIKVFQDKGDPHTATAQALLNKEKVSKDERQIAKSANFALTFGSSAEGLRIYAKTTFGINMTQIEAERHRSRFFKRYVGLERWHKKTGQSGEKSTNTRTLLGRQRQNVFRWNDKLNSPVQGDEADGLKQALAILWGTRDEVPSAVPVLVVHDEITMECDEKDGEKCAEWLKVCMIEGMRSILDPVPCDVEAKIGTTWGGE